MRYSLLGTRGSHFIASTEYRVARIEQRIQIN